VGDSKALLKARGFPLEPSLGHGRLCSCAAPPLLPAVTDSCPDEGVSGSPSTSQASLEPGSLAPEQAAVAGREAEGWGTRGAGSSRGGLVKPEQIKVL